MNSRRHVSPVVPSVVSWCQGISLRRRSHEPKLSTKTEMVDEFKPVKQIRETPSRKSRHVTLITIVNKVTIQYS